MCSSRGRAPTLTSGGSAGSGRFSGTSTRPNSASTVRSSRVWETRTGRSVRNRSAFPWLYLSRERPGSRTDTRRKVRLPQLGSRIASSPLWAGRDHPYAAARVGGPGWPGAAPRGRDCRAGPGSRGAPPNKRATARGDKKSPRRALAGALRTAPAQGFELSPAPAGLCPTARRGRSRGPHRPAPRPRGRASPPRRLVMSPAPVGSAPHPGEAPRGPTPRSAPSRARFARPGAWFNVAGPVGLCPTPRRGRSRGPTAPRRARGRASRAPGAL